MRFTRDEAAEEIRSSPVYQTPASELGNPFEDPDEPEESKPPVTLAHWPGECSSCGSPFQDGDEIYRDGSGGWAAVACCGEDVGL